MLVLTGESGSGKTTIELELVALGYEKALSLTTREKREDDIEGVTYKFVTEEEIYTLEKENKLGEHVTYLGNHYALTKDEIKEGKIAVVEPEGLRQLRDKDDIEVFAIYLEASEEVRSERMYFRGDSTYNIGKRLENDPIVFKGVEYKVDAVVNTENKSIEETVKEVLDKYINRG